VITGFAPTGQLQSSARRAIIKGGTFISIQEGKCTD